MKRDAKTIPGHAPGGGLGSNCLTENQQAIRSTPEPEMFRDERPTDWWNQHEANSHRGYARQTDGTRNGRRVTGGGGQGGGY